MSETKTMIEAPDSADALAVPLAGSPPPVDYLGPEDDPGKAWREYYHHVGILDEAFMAMMQGFLDEIEAACADLERRGQPGRGDCAQQRQADSQGLASPTAWRAKREQSGEK